MISITVGTALAQEAATTSATTAGGTAVIWDDAALSDAIVYWLPEVPPPAPGKEYVGWLVSDDDSVKLSTGPMTVAQDGSITFNFDASNKRYTGENLIHNYSKVVITMEAAGQDPDAPIASFRRAVFHHSIPLEAMSHIRHLLTKSPSGSDKGIITQLQDQIQVSIDHAVLARNSKTLDDVRLHTHHVINLIEGSGGANFDSGAGVPSPGDDKGVLSHANGRTHAGLAMGQAAGDEVITTFGDLVLVTGKNVEDFATQARDEALRSLNETDIVFAKLVLAGVEGLLRSSLSGVDADGDGTIEPVAGEGGAKQAYEQAQYMAIYWLEPWAPPPPQPVAEPTATPVPATPVPEPTATPSPTAEATPVSPFTGDTSAAPLAKTALLAAVLLLALGGGLLALSARRPRTRG